MSRQDGIELAYLVALITFIIGLKGLSSPANARPAWSAVAPRRS